MSEIEFFEHPEYREKRPLWFKLQALYSGDELALKGHDFLVPHQTELTTQQVETAKKGLPTLRGIREQISTYTNLMEPAVSQWISLLYRKPMNLDKAKDALGDLIDDVDGNGAGLESFIKWKMTPNYLLYSRPIVFVDADPDAPTNMAEQLASKSRFYMEMLEPLAVKDWQCIMARGQASARVNAIRWEYCLVEPRESLERPPDVVEYTKVATAIGGTAKIETFKKVKETNFGQAKGQCRWVKVEEYSKPLPGWTEIPVAGLFSGESWLKDAAEVQKRFYNHESELDMQLLAQAYDRIFVAGELNEEQKLAFNSHVVNFVPEGSVVTVVPAANTASLEKRIASDLVLFEKVAFNAGHVQAADSKEAPGAESQKSAKEERVRLAIAALTEIEEIINTAVMHAVHYMTGQVRPDKYVELDKNISVKDFSEKLPIFTAFRDDFEHLPEVKKAIIKEAVAELGLPDQETLIAEVDSTDLQAAKEAEAEKEMNSRLGAFGGA